jgi:hypothetical protein
LDIWFRYLNFKICCPKFENLADSGMDCVRKFCYCFIDWKALLESGFILDRPEMSYNFSILQRIQQNWLRFT